MTLPAASPWAFALRASRIAAIIYFLVVVPVNHLNERLKSKDLRPEAEPSNEEKLLAEIRDALRANAQGNAAGSVK